MNANLKYVAGAIAILIVCWLAYDTGYENARVEGELAIEQLKLAQAQEIIKAQNKVKVEYNEKVEALNADLANARKLNAERLRELERFNNADRDLAACSRDRRDLAELAVRGERLLRDAESYIRALRD